MIETGFCSSMQQYSTSNMILCDTGWPSLVPWEVRSRWLRALLAKTVWLEETTASLAVNTATPQSQRGPRGGTGICRQNPHRYSLLSSPGTEMLPHIVSREGSVGMLKMLASLLWLLLPPVSPEGLGDVVTCTAVQRHALAGTMTSSWLISSHVNTSRSIGCGILCLQDSRCVNFVYNDVTKNCHLFAIVMDLRDVASSVPTDRFFDTCRAAGYYGAACSYNSDCGVENGRCYRQRCRCKQGYGLDARQAKCVSQCTSYGQEFEAVDGYIINSNTEEAVDGLDVAACLQHCVEATKYVCRSVDFRHDPDQACATASVTKLDAPDDWIAPPSWTVTHYHRHCAL